MGMGWAVQGLRCVWAGLEIARSVHELVWACVVHGSEWQAVAWSWAGPESGMV
jgi:hypothetical protein